ncbi:MAG: heavy metal-associated domain-containing protein [Bacteroidota bacterium]
MKNLKFLFAVLFTLSFSVAALAQKKSGNETIKIKTSAECDMCKERIEKVMAYEKGVKKSTLDVESKILTVVFNPKKTSIEQIRKVISDTGYDADDVPANNKAYDKLPECCKKGAHK